MWDPGTETSALAGTVHSLPESGPFLNVEVAEDGTVWTTYGAPPRIEDECDLDEAGHLALARSSNGSWQQEIVDSVTVAGYSNGLAIMDDGTVLAGHGLAPYCTRHRVGIRERREDGWQWAEIGDRALAEVGPIVVGADGTTWAYVAYGDRMREDTSIVPWGPRLIRRTAGAMDWEVLGSDDSVPILIAPEAWDYGSIAAAADGRLWMVAAGGEGQLAEHRRMDRSVLATVDGPCAGVLSYDGTSWAQVLPGACATHVTAAPNGNVWVTVRDPDPDWRQTNADLAPDWYAEADLDDAPTVPAGLYVITPEAVAE